MSSTENEKPSAVVALRILVAISRAFFCGGRRETIEDQGERVVTDGVASHKSKVGKLYRGPVVDNRDVFRLKIEDGFVFLL